MVESSSGRATEFDIDGEWVEWWWWWEVVRRSLLETRCDSQCEVRFSEVEVLMVKTDE